MKKLSAWRLSRGESLALMSEARRLRGKDSHDHGGKVGLWCCDSGWLGDHVAMVRVCMLVMPLVSIT